VASILLAGYDLTVPPNGVDVTVIGFDLYFDSVGSIDENQMHLSLNLYEYSSWVDPRLIYSNNTNIPAYLRNSRIDFTDYRY
jgi:hypothetical protein